MSPTLNGSSLIRHFECSDAIKIHDGIIFDFYTGLSHVYNLYFVLVLDGAHLYIITMYYTMYYLPPLQSDHSQEVVDSLKQKVDHLENRLEKVR